MIIIPLEVKVKHFLESDGYLSNGNCPLARAAKEQFSVSEVCEGVRQIRIYHDVENKFGTCYYHECYDTEHYCIDYSLSQKSKEEPEKVIRTILLTTTPNESETDS